MRNFNFDEIEIDFEILKVFILRELEKYVVVCLRKRLLKFYGMCFFVLVEIRWYLCKFLFRFFFVCFNYIGKKITKFKEEFRLLKK